MSVGNDTRNRTERATIKQIAEGGVLNELPVVMILWLFINKTLEAYMPGIFGGDFIMIKRITALILIGILMTWNTASVAALSTEIRLFRDVTETDWFYPHLVELQEHNTFSGLGNNTFGPDYVITVGDFAVLLEKSVSFSETLDYIEPSEIASSFVAESTYIDDTAQLTRYDAAKMMTLLTGNDTGSDYEQIIPLIHDYELIPDEYRNAVLAAYVNGLLSGYPDGAFKGEEFVTRAEAAIMVSKLIHEDLRSDLLEKASAHEALLLEDKNIRTQLIETALQFQGVPYRWGGISPSGFDSSGFIWYVFQENGIDIPRVSFDIYAFGDPISQDDLKPGDLVFFEGYRPGPSHGSIYIGDGQFIHSPSTGKTITIDSLSDPAYWGPKRYGAVSIIK